ncbi:cellulase family glycosylhydrolase, partial [Candidatus Sumerlaeota bacterium]|nr:cellulase family glycosylhydrolase [Candidatus Sumerlaeota bacterium]
CLSRARRPCYAFRKCLEKTGYDALTDGCLKRGIRVLYILDYSTRLYESERSVQTDQGRAVFAAFAETAARRYSGKNIIWEIWNEPNIKQFWTPQPSVDDYCKLVEAAAPRIKQADPDAAIIAPATSQIPMDWLEQCFQRGLLRWIDGVSVHPYRRLPPETVISDYERLRELIAKYAPEGKRLPIVSGEWGYSLINWDKARLSEEQQARYLVRMFLINLYERIPISIWYDWKDDGTDPDEREHHFGTMSHDLEPKPAYSAAHVFNRTLQGYSVKSRLDLPDRDDYALWLEKGRARALAIWTTTGEHEISLPLTAGKGTIVNMFGTKKRVSWKDSGLKLTISENPIYLLISPN